MRSLHSFSTLIALMFHVLLVVSAKLKAVDIWLVECLEQYLFSKPLMLFYAIYYWKLPKD